MSNHPFSREAREERAEKQAEKRAEYLEFCKDHGMDPEDEASLDTWEATEAALEAESWDAMSDEDRAGWEDNMHK